MAELVTFDCLMRIQSDAKEKLEEMTTQYREVLDILVAAKERGDRYEEKFKTEREDRLKKEEENAEFRKEYWRLIDELSLKKAEILSMENAMARRNDSIKEKTQEIKSLKENLDFARENVVKQGRVIKSLTDAIKMKEELLAAKDDTIRLQAELIDKSHFKHYNPFIECDDC